MSDIYSDSYKARHCSRGWNANIAYMSKPSKEHWIGVKCVIRYINDTLCNDRKFTFHRQEPELVAYTVADWEGDVITRRSTSGYVFQFGYSAVSCNWSSRNQPFAANSSEAEYVALSSTAQQTVWLCLLTKDLGKSVYRSTTIFEDNQGAKELAKNPKYRNRTKHVDICHHFVRERATANIIKVVYCPTEDMIADIMTKELTTFSFQELRNISVY